MTRAVLVLAAAALAAAPPAAAAAELVALPSPVDVRAPGPPPAVPPAPPSPLVLPPGGLRAAQRVVVDLDGRGAPRAVDVVQRLVVVGTGDYTMGIEAPLTSVTPAAGTASEPGQRRNRILWRGFSAGGRVLAARVELRAVPAARALPLAVRVERTPGGAVVRLVNRTAARVPTFAGAVSAARTAALLDELRRGGPAARAQVAVRVEGRPAPRTLTARAALELTGSVRLGDGPRRPVRGRLEGEPLVVRLRGAGPLRLELEARPVTPTLEPTGGASWRAAVRRGTAPSDAALLERLQRGLAGTARARQYDAFLPVPGGGPSETVYAYRTVRAAAAPPPATNEDDGTSPFLVLGLVAGGLVAAGAALVAWAHL